MKFRQQLAQFVRQNPLLMRLAYYLYRTLQPKYSAGVVGVVLNEKQEILLVEHVFHPKHPWGLPGGWMDANEAPEHTVQREFREELGLEVDVIHLLLVGSKEYRHFDFAYLCVSTGQITTLSYELLRYGWYGRDQLPNINPFHLAAIDAAFNVQMIKE